MDKESRLTHRLIEAAVTNGIKYIEDNGNRGVRNIVDLGAHFAEGRFQKAFFRITQQILNNDHSMYYTFAKNTVKNVDHQIISKFGINLGYNSWTYGANTIRENEKSRGYNIPWTIVFDFDDTSHPLAAKEVSDILMSGETLGIYCAKFFIGGNTSYLKTLIPVLQSHSDSAYIIFADPDVISPDIADMIASALNIAVMLSASPSSNHRAIKQACDRLLNKKCIFGFYSEYENTNISALMSNEYLLYLQEIGCLYAYFIEKQPLNAYNRNRFSRFIKRMKNENQYSLYFIDFYQDIAYIDQIISVENCFMAINGKGRVAVTTMNELTDGKINVRTHSLQTILEQLMPKTHYI